MTSARVQPATPLAECPPWPTSHTLPRSVVAHLELATERLVAAGREALLQDVLALIIMFFAPGTSEDLIELLRKPHVDLGSSAADLRRGRDKCRLRPDTEQLMLWLPSPVTLRLNCLVDSVQKTGVRTTRRQVVSALVLHCLPGDEKLVEAFDALPTTPAKAATVDGQPQRRVLSLERPKPGRRPMEKTRRASSPSTTVGVSS